ncbi:MAG: hypothetical protein HXY42_12090 [Chloroflexi bacterium]|nr:hypothetical protein [Chloroflexota bacterium]
MPRRNLLPATFALLFCTLACRAATKLILPDTPTPQLPPTYTAPPAQTNTPDAFTPAPAIEDESITDPPERGNFQPHLLILSPII